MRHSTYRFGPGGWLATCVLLVLAACATGDQSASVPDDANPGLCLSCIVVRPGPRGPTTAERAKRQGLRGKPVESFPCMVQKMRAEVDDQIRTGRQPDQDELATLVELEEVISRFSHFDEMFIGPGKLLVRASGDSLAVRRQPLVCPESYLHEPDALLLHSQAGSK